MLCVNNNLIPVNNCNFKSSQKTKYVYKIGKQVFDSDTFVKMVDKSIYKPVKSIDDFKTIVKTCNFVRIQLQQSEVNEKRNLYKKLIKRCTDDIEKAIANRESEETVDKFTSILELFIRKFGYLDK